MIKRKIYSLLKKHLHKKEMTMLIGPRQVGKTTLMKQLHDDISFNQNKIWLNLDLENDLAHLESQNSLVQRLKLEFGDQDGVVFIDEIQRKENAGLYLKGIYDTYPQFKFVVSGSGSLELKERIVESLAGRKRLFEITPVSFEEFVDYLTAYKYEGRLLDFFKLEQEKTHSYLEQYILFGAYPAVITAIEKKEKKNVLSEIYNSYILRDIQGFLPILHTRAYIQLLKILSLQTAMHVKYYNLSEMAGISANTAKEYLWYMKHTFMIRESIPFFSNPLKEIKKEPLVYFVDLGLLNFQRNNLNPEIGASYGFVFQNFVFNELYVRLKDENVELKYWRTKYKAEVDIIIDAGNKIIPVEVKYQDMKSVKISRGFRSFLGTYQPDHAFIVNKAARFTQKIGSTELRILPFYELGAIADLL